MFMLVSGAKNLSKSLKQQPLFKFCSNQYPQKLFISAQEASQYTGDKNVKFLDARDIEDYKNSRIAAQTYCADMFFWYRSFSDPEEVLKMKDTFTTYIQDMGINKGDYVIAYEDSLNKRFGASSRAYYMFKLFGHNNVSVLNGGLDAWKQAGLPVDNQKLEDAKKAEKTGNFQIEWDSSEWLDKQAVLDQLNNKTHVMLDVRDDIEWVGDSTSPLGKDFCPRYGRLQGAVWAPWYNFMTEKDGVSYINEPSVVQEQLASKGIKDLNTPITIYCFKGARASNSYMALKNAGYTNVKNYFASWNEWSRDNALPIDDKAITL